jgi:DNA-binding PadR family transcriptional regulator
MGRHRDVNEDEGIGSLEETDTTSSPNNPSGRRKSAAFELFIMGEVMDGPHHGYLLRDILTRLLGPYRQISWAAIYPLIHRLEREGLIAPEPGATPGPKPEQNPDGASLSGRQRRRFAITAAGRERFFTLMLTPGEPTADYLEFFTIKLAYLGYLTPAQQRAIFAHCQAYLARQREHLRHVFTARSTTAHLPHDQREQIFHMMRFRLASVEAQLAWVARELAHLEEGVTDRHGGASGTD